MQFGLWRRVKQMKGAGVGVGVGGTQVTTLLFSPPRLMYAAQVAFIGFTKGLMTGIMRVM